MHSFACGIKSLELYTYYIYDLSSQVHAAHFMFYYLMIIIIFHTWGYDLK